MPSKRGPFHEREFNLDVLAQSESVFALSNGHIGLRGNLDEGEPCGLPGTYLNSLYEIRPLPCAEGGYGYPESGQTIINVTGSVTPRLMPAQLPVAAPVDRVWDTRSLKWAPPIRLL